MKKVTVLCLLCVSVLFLTCSIGCVRDIETYKPITVDKIEIMNAYWDSGTEEMLMTITSSALPEDLSGKQKVLIVKNPPPELKIFVKKIVPGTKIHFKYWSNEDNYRIITEITILPGGEKYIRGG